MSNKTILQTNNANLASYTDRVTALINVANSLPEVSGGSGEDLSTELTTQDTLLTELETVLAGKAAAGGSGGHGNLPQPGCGADAGCDRETPALQGECHHQSDGYRRRHSGSGAGHGILHFRCANCADELHCLL